MNSKKAAPKAKIVYVGADENRFNRFNETKHENCNYYDKEDKAKELNKDLDNKIASIMKDKTKNFNKTVMYLLMKAIYYQLKVVWRD